MNRALRGISAACVMLAIVALSSANARAAITELALYRLGEPGSFLGSHPQDSVGGHHFQNTFGTQTVIMPGALPGSTAANNYSPIGGSYSAAAGSNVIPTNNFAIEMWARTSNVGQANITMFSSGSAAGSLALNLDSGQWRASRFNQAYFGSGVPAVANDWVNLALIRSAGLTTFYVDGVAQGAPDATLPIVSAIDFHLGVTPGGAFGFSGDLDNLRIFSFDPLFDNPVNALTVNAPEPAGMALWTMLGVVGLFVASQRRKLARR